MGKNKKLLSEYWGDYPVAYLGRWEKVEIRINNSGLVVPDYPNLCIVYGPQTNLTHNRFILIQSESYSHPNIKPTP